MNLARPGSLGKLVNGLHGHRLLALPQLLETLRVKVLKGNHAGRKKESEVLPHDGREMLERAFAAAAAAVVPSPRCR